MVILKRKTLPKIRFLTKIQFLIHVPKNGWSDKNEIKFCIQNVWNKWCDLLQKDIG